MTYHTKKNKSQAIGNADLTSLDGANRATVAGMALRTCTPVSTGTRFRGMRLISQDF
jgi:hypothetical protein